MAGATAAAPGPIPVRAGPGQSQRSKMSERAVAWSQAAQHATSVCGQAGARSQAAEDSSGAVAAQTKSRGGNPWVILIVVSLGFFMTLLDLTIVNIAIPNMITKLHASLDDILWVINAYALVLAVLLITGGPARRPARTADGVLRRDRPVHGRVGRLRAGAVGRLAHRLPGRAGPRRGPADAADAGAS